MSFRKFFKVGEWPAWSADAIAWTGLVVYLARSFLFAHTTISNLDEGSYLYKGLLFAEGVYRPFQPYGVWTNKMPLAFLVPGYIQWLFDAGLRTGRYLAVIEGTLAVVGLWLAARRMSGKWLAAGAVWTMALGSSVIKVYSVGVTQSLVVCLLAWMLALSLGEKQPLWKVILAASLAGLVVLVRQNLVLVLPILMLYIFWQHGWRHGALASLAGAAVFVGGHIIYWPDILQIWTIWLPVKPEALVEFIPSGGGQQNWDPTVIFSGRMLSFFQGFRWHFVALTGSILSFFLLPDLRKWKATASFRSAVFLAVLFFSLLFLHSYASLYKDYCVFCFAPYVAFFNVAGILLAVNLIPLWSRSPSVVTRVLIILIVLAIATGTGYATFEDTGKWLAGLPVPRVREGQILAGFTTLGETLSNKFAFDQNMVRKISASAAGTLAGVAIVAWTFLIHVVPFKRRHNFGFLLPGVFLTAGFIFLPLLQGVHGTPDCDMDVIAANEEIGAYLAEVIPPDSTVFWDGGLSVAPMLYAPQARIYPPQINGGYSYVLGGDTDRLLKFGLWNDELAQKWRNEADFIIIEEWRYASWKSFLSPDRFQELPRTPVATSCLDATRLRIFERIR